MIIANKILKKTINIENNKLVNVEIENLIANEKFKFNSEEFSVSYGRKSLFKKPTVFYSSEAEVISTKTDSITYQYITKDKITFKITVKYFKDEFKLSKTLTISASEDVFLDYIAGDTYSAEGLFSWHRPLMTKRVYTKPYIQTLGQPVYLGSLFTAFESPVGDNTIEDNKVVMRYYLGRTLSQLSKNKIFTSLPIILGGASGSNYNQVRKAFFSYVDTFSLASSFRIQYNSWYDNMLDIDSKNIECSFRSIQAGFKASGLRDLDCYVVDDGWVDYKQPKFWSFIDKKFPDQFKKESQLTKEFNSTFGVWFGPRGGYSEALRYAFNLKKIGYNINKISRDICIGDTKYIDDLGDKFIEFIKEYNVSYFKIDGLAHDACPNKHHNHLVGGDNGLYFYTSLYENWCAMFDRVLAINPKFYINLTSYAHCSSFFLKYVGAIWMNNAADMAYIGKGSNLDQCLSYRDSRYFNLLSECQVQFPTANIYNHEPCYAVRNYNPPLPNSSHKTVIYTDAEFEKYLYCCMMRGSGFIEMYYSPELMSESKYAINARVLKWAEDNFNLIKEVVYFGGDPKDGDIYGYISYVNDKGILCIRNPSDTTAKYDLDMSKYTFDNNSHTLKLYYPTSEKSKKVDSKFSLELKPYEVKIFYID